MKYRKKPVVIEAVEINVILSLAERSWDKMPDWVKQGYEKGDLIFVKDGVCVKTAIGHLKGERTDWLIKGIEEEFYPCSDSVFRKTYEVVEE